MKKRLFFLLILLLSFNAFAQKDTTEKEIDNVVWQSFVKEANYSYRKSSLLERYESKKVKLAIYKLEEFILPENSGRSLEIIKEDGKENIFEVIKIAENYYCKTNKENWIISKKYCGSPAKTGIGRGETKVKDKFTVQESRYLDKNVKIYEKYAEFEREKNLLRGNKIILGKEIFFRKTKYWIDNEGLLLMKTYESGLVNSKELEVKETKTIVYNPKDLKVEAPIK